MDVVWTDDDLDTVERDHSPVVAAAVKDDLHTLEQQLDCADRKTQVRQRMDTVWRNFIGERYIRPEDRSYRDIYIITGHGVVFYDVIVKRKEKQEQLFRGLEQNRQQVIKDAELKIVEAQE